MKYVIWIVFVILVFLLLVLGTGGSAAEKEEIKPPLYHSIEMGAKMWLGTTDLVVGDKEVSFKSSIGIKTRVINPQNLIVRDE